MITIVIIITNTFFSSKMPQTDYSIKKENEIKASKLLY